MDDESCWLVVIFAIRVRLPTMRGVTMRQLMLRIRQMIWIFPLLGFAIAAYNFLWQKPVSEDQFKEFEQLVLKNQRLIDERLSGLRVELLPELKKAFERMPELRKAIEGIQNQGGLEIGRVEDLIASGKHDQARAALLGLAEKSAQLRIAAGRDMANTYRLLGGLLFANAPDEALEAYKTAANADPEVPEVWNQIGLLYSQKSNRREAIENYARGLRVVRKDQDDEIVATLKGNLGRSYALLGGESNLEKAESLLREALQSNDAADRQDAKAYNCSGLGLVYTQRATWSEAIKWFECSLKINEKRPTSTAATARDRLNLGRSYVNMYNAGGNDADRKTACIHLKKAYETFSELPIKDAGKEALDGIEAARCERR
jgi:tetratricopeptide (TPR) repeat protein